MGSDLSARPHMMAATLGATLMLIAVAAIGISYLRMMALYDVAAVAIYEYQPAHDDILFIDRDLYQAQLALERGAIITDRLDRMGQLTIFHENVDQTAARFEQFQERTKELADPTDAIASYVGYRDDWLRAAEVLVSQIEQDLPGEASASSVARAVDTFSEMRFALDRIASSMIEPAIQRISTRMVSEAETAKKQLVLTLIVALLIGSVVTVAGAKTIGHQHTQMLRDRDYQKNEARRKELEKRIRNAFELAHTEASAIEVTKGVLEAVVGDSYQTELLLVDSSFAHLRRATATGNSDTNGCNVLRPSDCPAIRRNARLTFQKSSSFDACPFLKGRNEDGCSAMCIPLSVLGRTAGVLHTVGAVNDIPNPGQEYALRALASQAGDVLGVLRALSTKDRQANTDALTGLDNRRSLEAKLPAIAARGVYSVAFGDLDKFKNLNDTHGHDIGDRALRLFADVLRASLRPDDLAGRWGGEEFVLVLPGVTEDKAVRVVERIRANLRENLSLGTVPSFTVSFGVCDSRSAESFPDVLNAADAALLSAKSTGRDRVVVGTEAGDLDAPETVEDSALTDEDTEHPPRARTA